MKIQSTPQLNSQIYFRGNWLEKFDKALGKFIEPKQVLTSTSRALVDQVETIARQKYSRVSGQPVKLSVKNGNKEFLFSYNNSAWHRITLSKKGEELCDFEIMHVKEPAQYDFYSTGGYPSVILDKRFIQKYNNVLEEWLPRLIKKCEKLEKQTPTT